MVKYICDRCGAIPGEDYKSPNNMTHNVTVGFFHNGHKVAFRSFDLCDRCTNNAVDLQTELITAFNKLVGQFLTKSQPIIGNFQVELNP